MKRETLEEYWRRRAMTEALRRAKQDVKDQIKRVGKRHWDFTAREIALRAEALIEANREAALTQAVERLIRHYERHNANGAEAIPGPLLRSNHQQWVKSTVVG